MRKKIFTEVFLAVFLLLIIPVNSAVESYFLNASTLNTQTKNVNHPKSYDIIIWRINKGNVDKEIITVDYDIAMNIKEEYDQIERNTNNYFEQRELKNAVMRKYNILNAEDDIENIMEKAKLGSSNRFYIIKNLYTKKDNLLYNYFPPTAMIVLVGILSATVHGKVRGINLGPPIPGGFFTLVQIAEAYGPANGFGFTFGFILNELFIEEHTKIKITLVASLGFMEYIPFILNGNDEGQFEIDVLTIWGYIR